MSLDEKLIINAALTGMVPTRQDSPHVPITPEEIARDARRCCDAGASIVHLHARDQAGQATYDPDGYRLVLQLVRAACPDVILCVSTSGRTFRLFEQRSAVLELDDPKPEMASLTLGSMNFAREESVNNPEMIRALALKMRQQGIVPELECFDLGMAEYANYLIKQDVLRPPFYANILLGNLGTAAASAFNLSAIVRALPPGATWAAAGIGRFQLEVNAMAVAMGGHVRVGLEDNLWFDAARSEPATNARLVERIAQLGATLGRPLASAAEARKMIGL